MLVRIFLVYTISVSSNFVLWEEPGLIELLDMSLLQGNSFQKAKILWNSMKKNFDIRELFIQCNTRSCCEHIIGGVNIYLSGPCVYVTLNLTKHHS